MTKLYHELKRIDFFDDESNIHVMQIEFLKIGIRQYVSALLWIRFIWNRIHILE